MSTRGRIPPLPLPRKQEPSPIEPVLIETIAAVAPAGRSRASFSTSMSTSTAFHGDGINNNNNSTSNGGGGAGAWLSADGVRGVAWEVEPEVRKFFFVFLIW